MVQFYDLLKVLRGRLAKFGQGWDVKEIEGDEAHVEDVESYDHVLDFYELVKTNRPKMFSEVLNKCIVAVSRGSWRVLNLSDKEVEEQLQYDIKKGRLSENLKGQVASDENQEPQISNKQRKRQEREQMLKKRFQKKKDVGRFSDYRKKEKKSKKY